MTHVVTPMAQAETAAGAGVSEAAGAEISEALRQLLADVFALYVKTKSFHWHVRGRHFPIITCCWMSRLLRSSR